MLEILEQYNLIGVLVGCLTFLIIGIYHPLVIKGEYYLGVKCWWLFFMSGILFLFFSVWVDSLILSILLSVLAFSSFWSILEVFQQHKRVQKGWFPKNPKRNTK